MSTTVSKRAQITVHGFDYEGDAGKNIRCIFPVTEDTVQFKSSEADGMIHDSQKDTLVADNIYITNTGE